MQTTKDSGFSNPAPDGIYRTKYGETPKLSSLNYRQWARNIQIFLRSENALAITLGEEVQPPLEHYQNRGDWIAREGKALAIIYNSCSTATQEHIEDISSASEMWLRLKEKFDTLSSRAGQLDVRRNFNQARAEPGQTIENYLATLLR